LRLSRRAGCIKGRVLQQPHAFGRFAARNGGGACRHGGERLRVIDRAFTHAPFDRRRTGRRKEADLQIVARVNALVWRKLGQSNSYSV
jgi:hypothetical protein